MKHKKTFSLFFTIFQTLIYIPFFEYLNIGISVNLLVISCFLIFSAAMSQVFVLIFSRFGGFSSWKVYSSIIHSKKLSSYMLFLFLAPTLIKVLNITDMEQYITPSIYVYWLCGLLLLVFFTLFYSLSPKLYRYGSFDSFAKNGGNQLMLRDDVELAISTCEQRKNNLFIEEGKYFEEDFAILKSIRGGKDVPTNKLYSVLSERLTFSKEVYRELTGFFLLFPLMMMTLMFVCNVYFVASSGIECTSWNSFLQGLSEFKIAAQSCKQ